MKTPDTLELLKITERGQRILITGLVVILIGIVLASVWLFVRSLNLQSVHELAEFIVGWGAFGPLVVVLLAILANITGVIPSYPLTLLSGGIWGPIWGTIIMVVGTMIGATISFLITRSAAFPWVDKFFRKHARIYTQMNDKYVTRFIFISRLFPFFVFELISYGAGLTRISFWHYFWATFFGIIPSTFLLAWSGRVVLVEGNIWIYALTGIGLLFMFFFPWWVEKYNPFGLKTKLLKS